MASPLAQCNLPCLSAGAYRALIGACNPGFGDYFAPDSPSPIQGGLLGTLAAGFISDKVFSGRRTPVIAIFTLGICPLCLLLVYAPPALVQAWPYTTFFAFGCCFTAPHVLIGLAARELTAPNVASTAGGFVAAISKFGSSVAGAPLGAVTQVGVPSMSRDCPVTLL